MLPYLSRISNNNQVNKNIKNNKSNISSKNNDVISQSHCLYAYTSDSDRNLNIHTIAQFDFILFQQVF